MVIVQQSLLSVKPVLNLLRLKKIIKKLFFYFFNWKIFYFQKLVPSLLGMLS